MYVLLFIIHEINSIYAKPLKALSDFKFEFEKITVKIWRFEITINVASLIHFDQKLKI